MKRTCFVRHERLVDAGMLARSVDYAQAGKGAQLLGHSRPGMIGIPFDLVQNTFQVKVRPLLDRSSGLEIFFHMPRVLTLRLLEHSRKFHGNL